MNIFGLSIERKARTLTIDQLVTRLEGIHETIAGIQVTPENCMESPTVNAIVTAISRRLSTLPVHVLRKQTSNGRTTKERAPNHPVQRLLDSPNSWQTKTNYWQDATSWIVRYGNHYAYKARGSTGPIRRLESWPAGNVVPMQDEDLTVFYRVHTADGKVQDFPAEEVHHARGPARNGVKGDSPIMDARESIALEIAAERFGGSFFGNGAMPGVMFEYTEAIKGFRSDDERKEFVDKLTDQFGHGRRFRSLLLPKGIKLSDSIDIDNERAQFLETRKYQRTVIAGAFGVPPHLVGDLERGTFNNVEQQSIDFVQGVVLPYAKTFESSMERDLLTPSDRSSGIIIRFNLEGALRGDFKTRQEGLKIQREAGVISANDWREEEGMNPVPEGQGGETYWQEGPSGQGGTSTSGDGDTDGGEPDD